MQRLAGEGWQVVAITGRCTLGGLAEALATGLVDAPEPEVRKIAGLLAQPGLAEDIRRGLCERLLQNHRLLLVLDNFANNLSLAGTAYLEPLVEKMMGRFCEAATCGKLLVTSRYPLPGNDAWLASFEIGPLSSAQTRKLFLRMGVLREREPGSLRLIERVIGGHPRMIEYLDAILNRGVARLPRVEQQLRRLAARQGIKLDDPSPALDEAIRRALEIGAADILLDELLGIVGERPADSAALHQAAVFPLPVDVEGLAHAVSDGPPSAPLVASLAEGVERLAASSLLTRLAGGQVWVHRWTAETLRARVPVEEHHEYCRRAGEYLVWRLRNRTHSLLDALEAMRLFLAAQAWDRAAEEGAGIVGFLQAYGRVIDFAAVTREMCEKLPEDHARYHAFLGTEGDALRGLGFGSEALCRYQRMSELIQGKLKQEPERADYQTDLVVSLVRIGGRENLGRARDILRRLRSENRLTHEQATRWIPVLENALRSS